MIKIIEVSLPEGMQLDGVQLYSPKSVAITFQPDPDIPDIRWRNPTKSDLLNVDSLPCRVWDPQDGGWKFAELIAVSSPMDGRDSYFTSHGSWKYAEIPVHKNQEEIPARSHLTAKLR